MSHSPQDTVVLTPLQERRRKAIERRFLKALSDLRDLATEISGDSHPDLFFEADGRLYAMRSEFRDEDPDRDTFQDRQSHIICSIHHGGIGSGAW